MERELSLRLEEFREGRLSKLKENKGPVPLARGKFIIHLVPEQKLKDPLLEFDISKIKNDVSALPLFGKKMRPGPLTYNLDGVLCRSLACDNPVYSYVQFFRDGSIEAVEDFYLNQGERELPIYEYEEELILKTGHYLGQLANLGVQPPVFFMLSILGAAEYKILGGPFNQDEMRFMARIYTSDENDPIKVLRPVLDQLWQAAGHEKSRSYNKEGRFTR